MTVDTLGDLQLQFKERMATEKRLLEKVCRIRVDESIVPLPLDACMTENIYLPLLVGS